MRYPTIVLMEWVKTAYTLILSVAPTPPSQGSRSAFRQISQSWVLVAR